MTLTQINKAGLDEIALDHVFTIGASGSSAYTFQGEGLNGTVNNPTLYLTRGKTYRFENGSGGHPIRIQSTSGASGTAYNTGVTNNAGSGTVIVEVQHDAPDVLYYQCTSHAAMNGILYITGALADGGVTTTKLAANAVTTAKIADDAITSAKIVSGGVQASNINSNAVSTGALQSNAVITAKIADDAVTNAKIAAGAVSTTELSNSGVSTNKIADDAVTSAKIAAGAVSTTELSNSGVSTDKIADSAVTGAKIASSAITNTKISTNGIASSDKIADGIITTAKIAGNAITNAKLADNAVSTARIADGAVNANKLGSAVVTTAKIEDDAVTIAKLADDAVGTTQISNNAVTGTKLADDAVGTAKIANNAVQSAQILDGAVGTTKIANNAITAAKLASGVGGKILQVKSTVKRGTFSTSSNNTERTVTGLNVSITPSSSSNAIIVVVSMNYCTRHTTYKGRIYRGGNLISSNGTSSGNRQTAVLGLGQTLDDNQTDIATGMFIDFPQSTSSLSYSVRVINDNGQTIYINRAQNDYNSSVGGRFGSSIVVMEVSGLSNSFT